MGSVNVYSAEGGCDLSTPPPELCAQRVQIVMRSMKRYLCLKRRKNQNNSA